MAPSAGGPNGRVAIWTDERFAFRHPGGERGPDERASVPAAEGVWAVAFACVISFMGIGLVDPILPALRVKLHATPAQV